MFDLTTLEGVYDYLSKSPFPAASVVALTGGLANFTYRITLREPYVTPGLDIPIQTLVMKHAEPYVAGYKDIPFGVERQEYECLAFKFIPDIVGQSSILNLPKLFYQDREHGVILISDCGHGSMTLKAVLQKGPLPDDLARNFGTALGTFVGKIHAATRDPEAGTGAFAAKAAFGSNDQAREIVGAMTYGSISSTLTADPPLLSPPLTLSPETLTKLDAFARVAQLRVNSSTDVLVVGDFWTGNVLVASEPSVPHLMVVDWEATRPGFAGMDLGQFLAELHLLRAFHPISRACVDIIIAALTSAYRTVVLNNYNRQDADRQLMETAEDAAARLGTHLITLTPRIPWGSQETTREAVQEGVEYILHSIDRDEAWLRGSLVGGLLN